MKKIMAMLVAFAMVATMFAPAVSAAPSQTVTSEAVVGGGSSPSITEYKIELNDDLADPGVQVLPNVYSTKDVKIYAAVSDPNGAADINRVEIKVWYPLTVPNVAGTGLQNYVTATEMTDISAITTILTNAVVQGVITDTIKNDILFHLNNGEWRFYTATTTLQYYDVAGDYTVMSVAYDNGGSTPVPKSNIFTYISIKAIGVDFSGVNYGSIIPGSHQIISGDDKWLVTPAKPTLRNEGNDPFKLKINASDMHGSNFQNVILATALDAKAYGVLTYAVAPNGFATLGADTNQNLYLSFPGVLFTPLVPPDTWNPVIQIFNPTTRVYDGVKVLTGVRPIDFSIDAPLGTAADTYTGNMVIQALAP